MFNLPARSGLLGPCRGCTGMNGGGGADLQGVTIEERQSTLISNIIAVSFIYDIFRPVF